MYPIGFNKKITDKGIIKADIPLKAQSLCADTVEFINRISNSTTGTILEFLEKNTKQIRIRSSEDSLYSYNNLLIMRTNGEKAYNLEQNIKILEGNSLAPNYVKYFQLGDNDFLTVLELPGKKVNSYSENVGMISEKTKQQFKSSIKDMLEKGFVNHEIFANKDAFLLSQNGDKILFADWSSLEPVSDLKKFALEKYLKNWQI